MEIILEVTLLLAQGEEIDIEALEDEEGIFLEKRLELPFVPFENLDLLLPGAEKAMDNLSDAEIEAMGEWIVISPELGTGVFRLARLAFDVEAGVFRAETDSINTEDATPSDIERFTQHLVDAFGFERVELELEDDE